MSIWILTIAISSSDNSIVHISKTQVDVFNIFEDELLLLLFISSFISYLLNLNNDNMETYLFKRDN